MSARTYADFTTEATFEIKVSVEHKVVYFAKLIIAHGDLCVTMFYFSPYF